VRTLLALLVTCTLAEDCLPVDTVGSDIGHPVITADSTGLNIGNPIVFKATGAGAPVEHWIYTLQISSNWAGSLSQDSSELTVIPGGPGCFEVTATAVVSTASLMSANGYKFCILGN
jgi:hypothetical protein